MQKKRFSRSVVLAALVAVSTTACEQTPAPTEFVMSAQRAGQPAAQAAQQARNEPIRVRGGVAADAPANGVARLIGPAGGTLEQSGHRLRVPAGAVTAPTLFRMRALRNGLVEVELKATRGEANGRTRNVGAAGFTTPVLLELSIAASAEAVDAERLQIVRVETDGRLTPLPSEIDVAGGSVRAGLETFSRYALATN